MEVIPSPAGNVSLDTIRIGALAAGGVKSISTSKSSDCVKLPARSIASTVIGCGPSAAKPVVATSALKSTVTITSKGATVGIAITAGTVPMPLITWSPSFRKIVSPASPVMRNCITPFPNGVVRSPIVTLSKADQPVSPRFTRSIVGRCGWVLSMVMVPACSNSMLPAWSSTSASILQTPSISGSDVISHTPKPLSGIPSLSSEPAKASPICTRTSPASNVNSRTWLLASATPRNAGCWMLVVPSNAPVSLYGAKPIVPLIGAVKSISTSRSSDCLRLPARSIASAVIGCGPCTA